MSTALTAIRWIDAGASAHALALLTATHTGTWFSIDGISCVSAFLSGTLAGTSLADIIFIVSIAVVCQTCERGLVEAEIPVPLDGISAAAYYGLDGDILPIRPTVTNVMWVDDLAVPIVAHADSLLRKSRAAFIVIWNSFLKFGLKLNLFPGKTALLPAFFGQRSEKARRTFAELPNGVMQCSCHGDNVVALPHHELLLTHGLPNTC